MMADPNGFAMNAGELKATARYFDQIQRASDRLGRTRYQNIIKLNNELKFTARHFDQIYRTALKLSRLKLMPRVTLDDKASGDIDRLIAKLGQIKSKRVQVAAEAKMPPVVKPPSVIQEKTKQLIENKEPIQKKESPALNDVKENSKNPNRQSSPVNTQSTTAVVSEQTITVTMPDFQAITNALSSNTIAIDRLSSSLGNLSFASSSGGESAPEKEKGIWDRIESGLGNTKKIGSGFKGVGEGVKSGNDFVKAWKDPAGPGFKGKVKKGALLSEHFGKSLVSFSDAGLGFIGGARGLASDFSSLASSSLIQDALPSFAKMGMKKLLGPIGYVADIANIAQATEGKERSQAIGATVGGMMGSAIPFVGPVTGAIGEWAGNTIGGALYDHKDSIKKGVTSLIGENNFNKLEEAGQKVTDGFNSAMDTVSQFGDSVASFFKWGDKKEETKPVIEPAVPPVTEPVPPQPYAGMIVNKPNIMDMNSPYNPGAILNHQMSKQNAPQTFSPMMVQATQTVKTIQAMPSSTNPAVPIDQTMNVQLSEGQLGTLSGMIQDAKAEVTNQISINISPGTVQLDIHEEIDYAEIEGKIGAAIVAKVRQAFQNYKPSGGGGGSAGPAQSMAT